MLNFTTQFANVIQRIKYTEQISNRLPGSVSLVAVSKNVSVKTIKIAFIAGQYAFAENYVKEALHKMVSLSKLNKYITWHYIGILQTNKIRVIAENFSWVHSVDNLKYAKKLSAQRSKYLEPLNVCIQVNVNNEQNKRGIISSELFGFATLVNTLPNLKLRGLMAIPSISQNSEVTVNNQYFCYRKLNILFNKLNSLGLRMDTLSMGMSNDMEIAITEGSTLVRVGTSLFGLRTDN